MPQKGQEFLQISLDHHPLLFLLPLLFSLLLFPLLLLVLLTFTVAVSMIVSALYPRFRDVGIIWTVLSTALFYATPVLYPLGSVSTTMRDIIALNPLTPIFVLMHRWVIDPNAAGPVELGGGGWRLVVSIAIYVVVCIAAVVIFRREAPRVAEAL